MDKIIKIRQSVFETNSSSTHSVSITSGTNKDLIAIPKVNDDGVVEITTNDYGWENARYNSLYDKLSYAATFALNINPTYNEYKQMLVNVIKNITGADKVKFLKNENSFYEYGYIDHQSWDKAQSIYNTEEILKQFLFNPKSYFTTGNDNQ